jgi:hypothetical protein
MYLLEPLPLVTITNVMLMIPMPCEIAGKQKGSFAAVASGRDFKLEEYHSSEKRIEKRIDRSTVVLDILETAAVHRWCLEEGSFLIQMINQQQ